MYTYRYTKIFFGWTILFGLILGAMPLLGIVKIVCALIWGGVGYWWISSNYEFDVLSGTFDKDDEDEDKPGKGGPLTPA